MLPCWFRRKFYALSRHVKNVAFDVVSQHLFSMVIENLYALFAYAMVPRFPKDRACFFGLKRNVCV